MYDSQMKRQRRNEDEVKREITKQEQPLKRQNIGMNCVCAGSAFINLLYECCSYTIQKCARLAYQIGALWCIMLHFPFMHDIFVLRVFLSLTQTHSSHRESNKVNTFSIIFPFLLSVLLFLFFNSL